MLRSALLLTVFLFPTVAIADCAPETREVRIIEAIVPGVDHVSIFTDDGLTAFLSGLQSLGLLVGVIPGQIDKVYVIEFRDIYHLFFLKDGCILYAGDELKATIQSVLP